MVKTFSGAVVEIGSRVTQLQHGGKRKDEFLCSKQRLLALYSDGLNQSIGRSSTTFGTQSEGLKRPRQQRMISCVSLLYPVKFTMVPAQEQELESFPNTSESGGSKVCNSLGICRNPNLWDLADGGVATGAAPSGGVATCSGLLAHGRRSKSGAREKKQEGRGRKRRSKEQTRRMDTLRRASTSSSPTKHFAYSSKIEAFASPPSLKGALGASRGSLCKGIPIF
ncbi:hypothetical protein DVH24_037639 [Malus domestica]|uniref:Uncharacterized protein n=1 Tax=Malus domestica TaxID=3750 RepID=A0A498J0Y0_MALDO|nr:hypothetical protein DVH24_037639 [Malus domestica]